MKAYSSSLQRMLRKVVILFILGPSAACGGNLLLDPSFEASQPLCDTSPVNQGPITSGSPWSLVPPFEGGAYLCASGQYFPADPLLVGAAGPGGNTAMFLFGLTQTLHQDTPALDENLTYEFSFDAFRVPLGIASEFPIKVIFEMRQLQIVFNLADLPVPGGPNDASGWRHYSVLFSNPHATSGDFYVTVNGGGDQFQNALNHAPVALDRFYLGAPVASEVPEPGSAPLLLVGIAITSRRCLSKVMVSAVGTR